MSSSPDCSSDSCLPGWSSQHPPIFIASPATRVAKNMKCCIDGSNMYILKSSIVGISISLKALGKKPLHNGVFIVISNTRCVLARFCFFWMMFRSTTNFSFSRCSSISHVLFEFRTSREMFSKARAPCLSSSANKQVSPYTWAMQSSPPLTVRFPFLSSGRLVENTTNSF